MTPTKQDDALAIFNNAETERAGFKDGRIGDLFWFTDEQQNIIRQAITSGAGGEWRPIDTVPENGDVLLYDCGVTWVGSFMKEGGSLPWFTYQYGEELEQATHWMPLPAAPGERG